ncbi:alpha/beta hydrolase fold domain-containing protein [Aidingimonas halophila]|uniref:Acetyl esterase n=1 Tax=Aidingimonas halophila TaxID=574349 RepID=A0A1H3FET9_9GAMM|nr:alpha/beta fold hydrolase [Aidingimonas halophila]GHC38006.1 carboxylesterase [Aidingimonas halophila]SDX89613.1 acetyl esterase [Aidingimonas halophila]
MGLTTFIERFEAGLAELEGMPRTQARHAYERLCQSFAPADPEDMTITDDTLDGVAVRRFVPAQAEPGTVVYLHGGGWTLGSVVSHHGLTANLAERLKRTVISVDYRLAPEADYAEALDDCLRVIDACAPRAVVGDSAGATLAIHAALAYQRPIPLGLIYPPVGQPSDTTLGPDAPLLSRADILALWKQVATQIPITMDTSTTPPTATIDVLAVEHDPLTAPLERAVFAWQQAGADVTYRIAPGMVHGALHAHDILPEMREAWQDFCQALEKRLG